MLPGALPSTMNTPVAGRPVVLVVEDEPQMRRFLVLTLSAHGFHSVQVGTRTNVHARLAGHEPDLIVLDIGHPGIDGVSVTSRMRSWTTAPIVAVLNPTREEQRTAVLDAGASDYLVKPFGTADLLGRVRVWLKQAAHLKRPRAPTDAAAKGVRLDAERRSLIVEGREVHITPLDYKLLQTLARADAIAMTEERLLQAVWGPNSLPPVQYLRARLRQLRQKIERDPTRPRYLLKEPNGGYRIKIV
jgi:two-component system, OmpR family, KDP operon response regulator KdpE